MIKRLFEFEEGRLVRLWARVLPGDRVAIAGYDNNAGPTYSVLDSMATCAEAVSDDEDVPVGVAQALLSAAYFEEDAEAA